MVQAGRVVFWDDEDEGSMYLGVGSTHDVSDYKARGAAAKRNPIGFVHFPDQPVAKAKRVRRRAAARGAKRRAR